MRARPPVDETTFVQWVEPALLAMTWLATRLAPGADVDDVVAEAVERAWRHRSRYDPERATPTTWLLALTSTVARDATRRTSRRHRLAVQRELTGVSDPRGRARAPRRGCAGRT